VRNGKTAIKGNWRNPYEISAPMSSGYSSIQNILLIHDFFDSINFGLFERAKF
jgi:hypothetical protein